MIRDVFFSIVELSVQASIIALIIYLVKIVFRKKVTIKFHYFIWLLVFAKLIIPININSDISVFNLLNFENKSFSSNAFDFNINTFSNQTKGAIEKAVAVDNNNNANEKELAIGTEQSSYLNVASNNITNNFDIANLYLYISYVWIFVVAFLLIYLMWNYLNLKINIYKKQVNYVDEKYYSIFDEVLHGMLMSNKIEIVFTDHVKAPFVFGLFNPIIVIPYELVGTLEDDEYRAIIIHEITHIRLNHNKIKLITYMITIIHWFNPFIWIVLKKMQDDAELHCDLVVIENSGGQVELCYLNALMKVATKKQTNFIPILNFGQKSSLRNRVESIVNRKSIPNYVSVISVFMTVVLSITLLTSKNVVSEVKEDTSIAVEEAKPIAETTPVLSETIATESNYLYNTVVESTESFSKTDPINYEEKDNYSVYEYNENSPVVHRYNAENITDFIIDVVNTDVIINNNTKLENEILISFEINYTDVTFNSSEEYLGGRYSQIGNDKKLNIFLKNLKGIYSKDGDPKNKLTISIPSKIYNELSITLLGSTLTFEKFEFKHFGLDSLSSSVTLSENKFDNLDLVFSSTSIELKNSSIAYDLNIENNWGSVDLINNTIGEELDIYNNLGDLFLETNKLDYNIYANVDGGDMSIKFNEKVTDIDIDIESLYSTITLPKNWGYEPETEYGFDSQSYSYLLGAGAYELHIDTEGATINITE